jgi:hypothetical protein
LSSGQALGVLLQPLQAEDLGSDRLLPRMRRNEVWAGGIDGKLQSWASPVKAVATLSSQKIEYR